MSMIEEISQNDIQASVDYMTKSHLRNVMQLAVFYTARDDIYAINISKIQSFLIKDDLEILDAPNENPYVEGLIELRGEIIYIVDFDKWLGHSVDNSDNKIIIICNYNQKKVGILVKDIIKIEEKASDELKIPSSKDPKISYVTDIFIESKNKTQLCIVFDAERLLFDTNTGDSSTKSTIYDIDSFKVEKQITSDKLVLVAEDSSIVIEKLNIFFKKLNLNYEIYENGQLLIDRLESLDPSDIGMVITDIEMPIKNGYQVIKHIKENNTYKNLPVISLTSMTNQGVKDKVMQLGAIDLINKSDLNTLQSYIDKILNGEIR